MAAVVLLLVLSLNLISSEGVTTIPGIVHHGDACASMEDLATARRNISRVVTDILSMLMLIPECGDGLWIQVASLNLSNTTQQCPAPWMEFTSPSRSCGRPQNAAHGCDQISFPVTAQYDKVCGRVTAGIPSSPDAFGRHGPRDNENYVDGVSITHSIPREHIWTFAADHLGNFRCPCSTTQRTIPPAFVGNNYFCDSTNIVPGKVTLWDGLNCGTSECCGFNSPPWFSIQLPAPTADNIDVRICNDEDSENDSFLVELLEVYVQ